jgi:hypothetical protein
VNIAERIIARTTHHAPDFIIGGVEDPYLLRWWVIPRNRFFNVYLHCFKRSDDDRARHTHPWLFNLSWLLRGPYREWTGDGPVDFVDRVAGDIKFRWGAAPHRVELTDGDCWTIFVTGPRVREWGFLCPTRFVHWKEFTAADNPGKIGPGCGE